MTPTSSVSGREEEATVTVEELVALRNREKLIFTAGPAALLEENLLGLRPCFGRGDSDYARLEEDVMGRLRTMSGHPFLARLQGSASLALEIMILNFLAGRVLVVSTGYYSDRLVRMAESAQRRERQITAVTQVEAHRLGEVSGRYDWVLACSTETSRGFGVPIPLLSRVAGECGGRLMLDATGSMGLEDGHELAHAMAYSSCKGLFGLTGAAFIAFHERPDHEVDSFYLNLSTHLERGMTGPYHALASLWRVLPRHGDFRASVVANKARFLQEMNGFLTVPPENQPLLCTHVNRGLTSLDSRAVLYRPRGTGGGSVVCHLGEVHLGLDAQGQILDALTFEEPDEEVQNG